ncbi:MAG: NAD(+)/NADH kinase [Phycisphaerae bacterium]|nr:NAD(+)/NADH kinase [Phycisphaerae bacterium]
MAKPKIIIFGDPQRQHAMQAMDSFVQFAEDRAEILATCHGESCPINVLKEADFAVVFGGDGTILSAARELCETRVPVIGVNVGKLGFLAEFAPGELQKLFDRISTDKSLIEKRMILDCRVESPGNDAFTSRAVNDVVITAGEPFRMIELKMSVQGQPLASCPGDGIIISTPTGSTAYNLSAGGPILSANLAAIVITPVCPHSLSFRPIVINAESIVEIHAMRVNEGTTVTLDGQVSRKFNADDKVIVKRHNCHFLVVNNPLRTQWDTLAGKLNWAGSPRYRTSADH